MGDIHTGSAFSKLKTKSNSSVNKKKTERLYMH